MFSPALHCVCVQPQTAEEARRARVLLISFVLMIAVGLGNRIMGILEYKPMYNYPLFVNLLTTLAYLPFSLMYIIPMAKYRTDVITPQARAVPQRVWLVMGTLDSVAGVLQSAATSQLSTSPSLVVLLLQSAIPVSMIITRIFLKTKYKLYQFGGAALVMVGIVVVLVPSLASGASGPELIIWSVVLIVSCVPMCLSSVYKEKNLGDVGTCLLLPHAVPARYARRPRACVHPRPHLRHTRRRADIDPVYMNFWVAVYQFIMSWPLLVPMWYSLYPKLPISDLPRNLWNGARCYAGINSIQTAGGPFVVDDCASGPAFVNVYILFNLGYNVLIILMLKYGSSNILWLCLTLQVPIANLAFGIPGMPNYQKVSWEDGVGLVVVMAGLIIYRFYIPARDAVRRLLKLEPAEDAKKLEALAMGGSDATNQPLLMDADSSEGMLSQSPSGMGGSTPVRGMHTHVTRAYVQQNSQQRADAVAAARHKVEMSGSGTSK
ncbi:hypothetical protein EON62_02900, partial [archaeon]